LLLGGGALALGLVAAPALAKEDDEGNKNQAQQGGKGTNGGVTDVKILNYALVLERREYEFYRRHHSPSCSEEVFPEVQATRAGCWSDAPPIARSA
jgi:hypothetical protein